MDDDEDIFSMLDGFNHNAEQYRRPGNHQEQQGMQWPRQQQIPPLHSSIHSQQVPRLITGDWLYEGQQRDQTRQLPSGSQVDQQEDQRELCITRTRAQHASHRTQAGFRDMLGQYAYEDSSPAPEPASTPTQRAGQPRTDDFAPHPRLTHAPRRMPVQVDYSDGAPQRSMQVQQKYVAPEAPPMIMPSRIEPKRSARDPDVLSTHVLPDRFRSVFAYPNFNAMQTKCFSIVYESNDNFVLSSPTGSGKTVIFELAICRIINSYPSGQFKIVYQAPTKSLCSERQKDWQQKFRGFHMEVAELTGDTEPAQMRNVQAASILITTPEKWDSVTRKWKDHEKLMNMIKLFLIDEVHMLHDTRGATLEAVVSRMKSVHSEVRFIALSATVPNSNDIAAWLCRDHEHQDVPAREQRFGEEYRPVPLQKHVIGYQAGSNDFSFEKYLDSKLPEVIAKYSHRKPIMIFCMTRKSCEATARRLAEWWSLQSTNGQYWRAPKRPINFEDKGLCGLAPTAVVYHHAGLGQYDKNAIQAGFTNGDVNVVCCTSTLAVGVNLPCHMVILKNTVTYTQCGGVQEYSDLEVMQMLGRAGRPQYDTSAVAVIMTRQEKAKKYERMVSGKQILESCLHENLIEHLNAEIGLGTVTNLSSAKKWLASTFLYVRLQKNPNHYRLNDGTGESNIDARLENICCRDMDLLRDAQLIDGDTKLEATPYGAAMARYVVRFETAKQFLRIPKGATISELLSTLSRATEWQEIRFRGAERSSYKELNNHPQIRFPIPVHLETPAHKVSLIIQAALGAVALPVNDKTAGNAFQFSTDTYNVFQHLRRLIRCIIDFKCIENDSVSLRNALFLCRSIGARCWDDWSLVLKQIDNIGPAGVHKLVAAGINSIDALENTPAHCIEMILKRNPPFGLQVIDGAKAFPKLRLSISVVGKPVVKAGKGAKLNIDAEIGFLNEKPVILFQRTPVFLVFLAETSDGINMHFARSSAKKVGKGQKLRFSVNLTTRRQSINCFVMCEEIAGTCTSVALKPTIPSVAWPANDEDQSIAPVARFSEHVRNTSKRRSTTQAVGDKSHHVEQDEYGDALLDESDLIDVLTSIEQAPFHHIDLFAPSAPTSASLYQQTATQKGIRQPSAAGVDEERLRQPVQRPDGKWECNHACKDKDACKHYCCNHGVEKPPRAVKRKLTASKTTDHDAASKNEIKTSLPKGQTTLSMKPPRKRAVPTMGDDLDMIDVTQTKSTPTAIKSNEWKRLEQLDSGTKLLDTSGRVASVAPPSLHQQDARELDQPLSLLPDHLQLQAPGGDSTDYGPGFSDFDLPDDPQQPMSRYEQDSEIVANFTDHKPGPTRITGQAKITIDGFGESDSSTDDVMVGLAHAQALQNKAHLPSVNANHPAAFDTIDKPLKPPKTRAPFLDSSGDVTMQENRGSIATSKRPVDVTKDGQPSPLAKRLRQDMNGGGAWITKPESEQGEIKGRDKSSDIPSDIDPTILAMFGQYVDFV